MNEIRISLAAARVNARMTQQRLRRKWAYQSKL